MHRELKLVENGITIASYYSDHNDHENTLNQDMEKFMSKIKTKQAGNFDWVFELKKAFKSSFPEIITKTILKEEKPAIPKVDEPVKSKVITDSKKSRFIKFPVECD